jgi:hypothetical protein
MYLRGALVSFMPTKLIPIPNVIVFQFNPETMTHTWTQAEAVAPAAEGKPKTNPLAVKGFPGEQFSFTIAVDAGDTIADGAVSAALAEVSGVYTRLAAMEMLMFPASATQDGLLGTVTAAIGGLFGATAGVKRQVPSNVLPTTLFVWGPGRIVPVRVTSLTITEKLYDGLLNPTHADAQLGLRVLTAEELAAASDTLGSLAKTAYNYSMGLREVEAVANLINSAESIIGMLAL